MTYKIVLLPGDGIGPEVTAGAKIALQSLEKTSDIKFEFTEKLAGGAALDAVQNPLPDDTIEACKNADAVLLGAVGGPKWDKNTGDQRPESGLLKLRSELGVYANLRPVSVSDSLSTASPLREDLVSGIDLLVVRELTGGIYFGEPRDRSGEGTTEKAFNTMRYSAGEIERVARVAFKSAQQRGNKVTSVDKANVLVVSQLWREVVNRVHQQEFPDVELDHLYVDNAAMQLVLNPKQFDVILTGNLFGDILSDLSATLAGSLGMLPSASFGGNVGLYEPIHGSAPDLAGQNKANPIAMILSTAMMLDQFGETASAGRIRDAVNHALSAGNRTADIWQEGDTLCSTTEMISAINEAILTPVTI